MHGVEGGTLPPGSTAFELLILDCDGVVVDSESITTRVLTQMLNALGASIDEREVASRFTGHTFARTLELIGQLLPAPLPADFVHRYGKRTYAALEAELKPVPGIGVALDQIAIPYCIASNGPHEKMQKTLGITALLSRFEGRLFSSADVPRGKPFPDLYLFAARHFAKPPCACLVIEDSESGVVAALAAGMSVYGFCRDKTDGRLLAAGAHRVFHDMSELPGLVAARIEAQA
ncbi:MAG: HAD family hydrolase [Betaproteobacteria bacterium]|nr:MAG: HAD family hydrolase [Betaproteobacteria bacterium]